ncbi:pyridoxal-phosphate dependent enzyme [Brasilonema sp. CT11]|nr:pyridoxal-phosphate dependent enzyme [Brasilonema sp. CT11]
MFSFSNPVIYVDLLVEATAGNTGIGLIHIAKQYNYNCLFVAPDKTSSEKVDLLKTLGAQVELSPTVPITGKCSANNKYLPYARGLIRNTNPVTDPNHFFNVAQRKAQELNAVFTNQFDNLSNYKAHYE